MTAKCPKCGLMQMWLMTCKACGTVLDDPMQSAPPNRPAPDQEWGAAAGARWRGMVNDHVHASVDRSQMPFFIKIGMYFYFFAGIMCLLFALIIPFAGASGTFYINGQQVTQEYFTSQALPPIVLVGFIFLAIGYVFWSERPWSRHLIMVLILMGGVDLVMSSAPALAMAAVMIDATISGWYFYYKPNVVDYYRGLASS